MPKITQTETVVTEHGVQEWCCAQLEEAEKTPFLMIIEGQAYLRDQDNRLREVKYCPFCGSPFEMD